MNNNEKISKLLREAANQHKSPYGKKALEKTALIIKHLDFNVKSSNDVKGIKGIGVGSLKRIDEILRTGFLEESSSNKSDNLDELKQIYGIGDVYAKKLYDKGVKTIEDLKKSDILLNSSQKIGLKYYKDFQLKIPRSEIKNLEKYFKRIMDKISKNVKLEIVGSYRRQKNESGDVDILLTGNNYLEEFVMKMKEDNFLVDDLCWGDKKYMGVYKNDNGIGRRIDIRFIDRAYYYPALLHYTGSGEHNIKLRQKAIDLGYRLNEYGLYNGDKKFDVNSEKEIFDILGVEYVEPRYR